ncbi:superantigen-like protein SSL4 [Candidatus Nitrospira nitrificans]|uniref:Uncharacterized protein n=1 Tax=Candidatus Nitrospira nitrificans TaxID=1742973 RepID=A0A0S4LKQ7_9BACT|nr:hypothetical protein [Candidatus Nitrospira nitrificans]CUS36564.1 exported hypothetical protein [Candidatus Nitrospira nitrificans]
MTIRTPRSLFPILLLQALVILTSFAACNNSGSGDNAAKKTEAPASNPALTSSQLPPSPAATETQSSNAPQIDPNAPIPALSTNMIEAFSKEIPELAQERETILNAEQEPSKA